MNLVMEENIMDDSISNIEIEDMPDGSGKLTMDMSPEVTLSLMKQGLKYMISEMRMHDKIEVLEPNTFGKETRTWVLSDDDFNVMFHFGVISALKAGMANYDKIFGKKEIPIGEDTRPKDRVKLGVSPSTIVEEWDCTDKL